MSRTFASVALTAAIGLAGLGLAGCSKGDTDQEKTRQEPGKEKGPGPAGTASATDRPHVSVLFAEVDKAQFADVKPGDRITVKGSCGSIYDGKRVPISGATRYTGKEPTISAEQLTKEFVSDKAKADAQYKFKEVIVEGVVADKQDLSLVLEGFK